MSTHSTHPNVAKRLRRAHGHLTKVIDMIESGQPCLEVAQQLQAVVNAISAAKTIHVQDHIEHCLVEALEAPAAKARARVNEFKEIAKYL